MNHATPFSTLGLQPSFGFGDRLGLATPGHVESMRRAGAGLAPIFAQQSIREMTRTRRTPQQVVADAVSGLRQANWQSPSGADADHLKTKGDVDATAAVGFTFYTIDPSDFVDADADDYDDAALAERFAPLRETTPWCEGYVNECVPLAGGHSFMIERQAAVRCVVKYGRAIEHAIELGKYILEVNKAAGRKVEIELSVDETRQPTSLAEHYIIADQFRRRGVPIVSLAPRFIGEFEKGVDYKGDLAQFEASLADHAHLAAELGPYKLSLHSGSDKLSLYPILARVTAGRYHVKTAGTSYLEALRVVARHDAPLFREIIRTARQYYERDRATYHVSAELDKLPEPDATSDVQQLERCYLECWSDVPPGRGFTEPGRQVLHCTFGTVLQNPELATPIYQLLQSNAADYTEVLADHFARHLHALTNI